MSSRQRHRAGGALLAGEPDQDWRLEAAPRVSRREWVPIADLAFAVAAVLVGLLAGIAGTHGAKVGIAVAVMGVGVVLAARRPVNVAVLAAIGVFFVQRVGGTSLSAGSGGGVSYSDALLATATLLALPAVIGSSELRRLKSPLAGVAAYLVCLLPSVLLNATHRGYFEWAHRLVLVAGSLVVGAWIVREGYVRIALRGLTVAAMLLSALAMQDWARHGFQPASPLSLNKNFVGAQLGAILLVIIIARRRIGLTTPIWLGAVLLVGCGLLVAQSRGADLAAALGLLIAFFVSARSHSRGGRIVAIAAAAVMVWFTYDSVSHQLKLEQSQLNTSSIGVRFNVERVTRDIWRTSPAYGVGLKYFNGGGFGYFAQAANNVVDNELAESGVIGLAGFATMQAVVAAAGIRRRRTDPLVVAGSAMVLALLLHGMVDIYWTAGVVPLPFLVLGMGLSEDASSPDDDDTLESRESHSAHRR